MSGADNEDPRTRRLLERERRRAERMKSLAEGPPSPCISICQMDERTNLCKGCHRTIDEIREWIITPPAERHRILAELEKRRHSLPPALAAATSKP